MVDRNIKYTATIDSNPFAAGGERIAQQLAQMRQRLSEQSAQFKTMTDGMRGHMASVTSSVRDEVAAMGGHFGSLLGALGSTKAGFASLIAVAAGIAAGKVVKATADMTESAMDLGRVLGSSTNEAQRWRIALEDVGASQAELEGAAKGLSRQLRENEGDLNAMGLKTRDANGQLRPMNDLLVDGLRVLNEHKEGVDRSLAGQVLFGRGVDASSRLLLINQQTLEDATETMQDLGLEVGGNAVQAWGEFDSATDRAGFSLKGVAVTAGRILMPVVTDLVNVFSAAMPAAIRVVQGALGGLATGFHVLKNGVVVVWETINAFVISVAEPIRAVVEALGRAMVGDFSGAATVIRSVPGTITSAWSAAMERIADSSQRTRDRIAAIWSDDTMPGKPVGELGSKGFKAPPKVEKTEAKADPSQMGVYEEMLAQERRVAAEKDALREYSKEQEVEFWRTILQQQNVTAADRLRITRKVADLETQILRESAKQRQALDAEMLKGQQDRALGAVEAARAEAQGQFALGEVTRAQLLQQEMQFEEQRNEIKRQYLAARLAMVDPERDPVQYEQISQQIEELERAHRLRLKQIDVEAKVEANDNPLARTIKSAEQAFADATSSILQRQQTLRQGLASVWGAIRASIAGEIGKILAAKVAAFARERLLALAGIGTKAAEAGAGAAASQASIPIVGPGLALAAMGAIMAAVLGLGASVPSAERGWDIPAGVNPMTQLHEREMVLPQGPADVIRDLADGGGAGGGGLRVEVKGVPVGDFFMVHRHDLVDAFNTADRERMRRR